MVTTEEGFCRNDADCSAEQYCYDVSERCVDYTHCSRYNREENQKRSRNPSQCGPCLPGYSAEKLSTGEIAALCRKINASVNAPEIPRPNSHAISYITVGLLVACFLIAAFGGVFFRMRSRKRKRQYDPEHSVDLCAVKPSAPPVESNPLIDCGEKLPYVPFNNNRSFMDKNRLVSASGFKAPDWVRSNPNYESNLNNGSTSAMDQLHAATELPPTNDNSNTWTAEPLTPSTAGIITEYEMEEMDNNANTILSNDNNILANNNNNSNGNNNQGNSSTSENNSDDNRRRGRALNILLIFLNIKVRNSD